MHRVGRYLRLSQQAEGQTVELWRLLVVESSKSGMIPDGDPQHQVFKTSVWIDTQKCPRSRQLSWHFLIQNQADQAAENDHAPEQPNH